MKGIIAFFKMWTALLLNWVIPANGSQEIFRRIASTYQQAEAFSGAFSQHAERKQADIFEWRRVMLDDMAKERAPAACKKTSKRVRAGPELYMRT